MSKPKKYKSWGTYSGQTVLAREINQRNQPYRVIVKSNGYGEISVNREEIPSLIIALLEVGNIK